MTKPTELSKTCRQQVQQTIQETHSSVRNDENSRYSSMGNAIDGLEVYEDVWGNLMSPEWR